MAWTQIIQSEDELTKIFTKINLFKMKKEHFSWQSIQFGRMKMASVPKKHLMQHHPYCVNINTFHVNNIFVNEISSSIVFYVIKTNMMVATHPLFITETRKQNTKSNKFISYLLLDQQLNQIPNSLPA